jgi:hypothetical protein
MSELIDKKIGDEVEGNIINDLFDGYVFKIQGGFDKDGFAMKNGILTAGRKRILLEKGDMISRFLTSRSSRLAPSPSPDLPRKDLLCLRDSALREPITSSRSSDFSRSITRRKPTLRRERPSDS